MRFDSAAAVPQTCLMTSHLYLDGGIQSQVNALRQYPCATFSPPPSIAPPPKTKGRNEKQVNTLKMQYCFFFPMWAGPGCMIQHGRCATSPSSTSSTRISTSVPPSSWPRKDSWTSSTGSTTEAGTSSSSHVVTIPLKKKKKCPVHDA